MHHLDNQFFLLFIRTPLKVIYRPLTLTLVLKKSGNYLLIRHSILLLYAKLGKTIASLIAITS